MFTPKTEIISLSFCPAFILIPSKVLEVKMYKKNAIKIPIAIIKSLYFE